MGLPGDILKFYVTVVEAIADAVTSKSSDFFFPGNKCYPIICSKCQHQQLTEGLVPTSV